MEKPLAEGEPTIANVAREFIAVFEVISYLAILVIEGADSTSNTTEGT